MRSTVPDAPHLTTARTAPTGSTDRLADFRPLVSAIRWGTLAVGVVLAAPAISDGNRSDAAWLAVLVVFTVWRTVWPLAYRPRDLRSTLWITVEVGVAAVAVMATGYWNSPLVFSLLLPVIAAGFAEGFAFSLRVASTAAVAVSVPLLLGVHSGHDDTVRSIGQWSVELLLVALVAGYGRRLFTEAEARTELALDRMSRLAEANALLFSLHRVAQDLPSSLDLGEVVASTMARLRDLIGFDSGTILVREESTSSWAVAAGDGLRLESAVLGDDGLPPPLLAASQARGSTCVSDLAHHGGPGLAPSARSGLYAPLRARGTLVALIALEDEALARFGARDVELLDGLAGSAALAIDNARWFGRLRTVGADEERTRIARDLHDRIGQSLAALAFQLDRVAAKAGSDPVRADLDALRRDVRTVVGEVRETLYDLRTDVSDDQGVAPTIERYLERVHERTGLRVDFDHGVDGRLPLPQERELWRIAQEAIANVERHAGATNLRVRWWCDGSTATLEVHDDGKGMVAGSALRSDAYGMLGMRERADSIGAHLAVTSEQGDSTTVRCTLGQP